jgi:hypothetical protein
MMLLSEAAKTVHALTRDIAALKEDRRRQTARLVALRRTVLERLKCWRDESSDAGDILVLIAELERGGPTGEKEGAS